jgi:hypothetical protein
MSRRAALALGLLLLSVGCIRKHVEVKIEPRPDGSFLRTLRMWNTDTEKEGEILPPDKAMLANAAKHYLERAAEEGAAAQFQGTFYAAVPPDLLYAEDTNRGRYTVWRSPLGHMAYYRERRPGRADVRTRFAEVEESLDLLVKVMVTVARQQLDGEKGLEKLVAYLEGPFRRDLAEAALHFYALNLHPQAKDGSLRDKQVATSLSLVLQLAEERGHVKAQDLPRFAHDGPRVQFLMQMVARRMERPLDDALGRKLAFLGEQEKAKPALEGALGQLGMTPEQFQQRMKPITDCVLNFRLFEADPEVSYTLALPRGADVRETSGTVNKEASTVAWTTTLSPLPVSRIFFAFYSVPDEQWQTTHLGGVVLQEEALEEYIGWENSLDKARAAAWRTALDRLDPQDDLTAQLEAIHVTPTPAEGEPQPEYGARLLLHAIARAKKAEEKE